MDKEERQEKILSEILEKPRTWNELLEITDVSEPTLSRDLKELRDKGAIRKDFDSEDNIVYIPKENPDVNLDFNFEEIINTAEKYNELRNDLDSLGLFSEEGLSDKNILKFMDKNIEFLKGLSMFTSEDVEIMERDCEKGQLSLRGYINFYNLLLLLLMGEKQTEIEVSSNLSIHTDIENVDIKGLRKKINALKEGFEEWKKIVDKRNL